MSLSRSSALIRRRTTHATSPRDSRHSRDDTFAGEEATLRSGGSTLIAPLMRKWAAEYRKLSGVSIDYASTGSGMGISGMTDKRLDFGCTDAPMSDTELRTAAPDGRYRLAHPAGYGFGRAGLKPTWSKGTPPIYWSVARGHHYGTRASLERPRDHSSQSERGAPRSRDHHGSADGFEWYHLSLDRLSREGQPDWQKTYGVAKTGELAYWDLCEG
jgi:hypothetical protein